MIRVMTSEFHLFVFLKHENDASSTSVTCKQDSRVTNIWTLVYLNLTLVYLFMSE